MGLVDLPSRLHLPNAGIDRRPRCRCHSVWLLRVRYHFQMRCWTPDLQHYLCQIRDRNGERFAVKISSSYIDGSCAIVSRSLRTSLVPFLQSLRVNRMSQGMPSTWFFRLSFLKSKNLNWCHLVVLCRQGAHGLK